jgi:DNA-binding transcriptional LysR family regulator
MTAAPSLWPPPVDLYGLGLLRLIAVHGSITRAAAAGGLTQSALTRQVQGIEQRLGVALFDRTTRTVRPTPAGEAFLRDTAPIHRTMEEALRRLGQEHLDAPREVRLGVSSSIALAHLPGLLHAHLRRSVGVKTIVEHLPSPQLISRLESGHLDVAVLCPSKRLPTSLSATHSMDDEFQLIAPAALKVPTFIQKGNRWPAKLTGWLNDQSWLLLHASSQTGQQLRRWRKSRNITAAASMEPDDFDLIIHLVALGLGISLVPRRALAGFPRKNLIQRVPMPETFTRRLAVVVPKLTRTPRQVAEFVSHILFS